MDAGTRALPRQPPPLPGPSIHVMAQLKGKGREHSSRGRYEAAKRVAARASTPPRATARVRGAQPRARTPTRTRNGGESSGDGGVSGRSARNPVAALRDDGERSEFDSLLAQQQQKPVQSAKQAAPAGSGDLHGAAFEMDAAGAGSGRVAACLRASSTGVMVLVLLALLAAVVLSVFWGMSPSADGCAGLGCERCAKRRGCSWCQVPWRAASAALPHNGTNLPNLPGLCEVRGAFLSVERGVVCFASPCAPSACRGRFDDWSLPAPPPPRFLSRG
jgi:hypothetical protein